MSLYIKQQSVWNTHHDKYESSGQRCFVRLNCIDYPNTNLFNLHKCENTYTIFLIHLFFWAVFERYRDDAVWWYSLYVLTLNWTFASFYSCATYHFCFLFVFLFFVCAISHIRNRLCRYCLQETLCFPTVVFSLSRDTLLYIRQAIAIVRLIISSRM